jgi:quinone-modifying oxidoreductase subunit QmoB
VRQIAINEYNTVDAVINEFVEAIVALGPNPFKGF